MSDSSALQRAQKAFMAQVLDENTPPPDQWNARQVAGMDVYRSNYRSAVVDAVNSTYERTRLWVGEEAFKQAAIHHVITHPPAGWTIDEAGYGFAETCQALFVDRSVVAELAWLEWAMLRTSRADDVDPMTAQGFAAATEQFEEADWGAMVVEFLPGSTSGTVQHDLHAVWQTISAGDGPADELEKALESERGCIVWREGDRPVFMMVDAAQARAFAAAQEGRSYGEICQMLADQTSGNQQPSDEALQDAAMAAGAMLGQWLNEGLISVVKTA